MRVTESRTHFTSPHGLHYGASMKALGRKRFPTSIKVDGLGNGYDFERVKVAMDKSFAFYKQRWGMATITLHRD